MSYEEFANRVRNDLQQRYSAVLGNVEIELQDVSKLQGESYNGISVRPAGQPVAASFPLDEMYARHEDGISYEGMLIHLVSAIKEAMNTIPTVDAAAMLDYEWAKSRLMVQAIPIKGNETMLKDVPHETKEDIACVYRIKVDIGGVQNATAFVNNRMLDNYGITAEQLKADALESAAKNTPFSIRTMSQVMSEKFDIPEELFPPAEGFPLYVATCNDGVYGAGCMFFPDFMKKATEQLHGDFYILPSSIHELLLVPDDGNQYYPALEEMVREVNESEVQPADRLSNSVYHYDSRHQIFEKAAAFAERTQSLQARIEAAREAAESNHYEEARNGLEEEISL